MNIGLRRVVTGLLCLVLCVSLFTPAFAISHVTSSGSIDGSRFSAEYGEKLNKIFKGQVSLFTNTSAKFPLGSSLNVNKQYIVGNMLGGYQCYIYAQAVYYYLFGDIPYRGDGMTGYWSNSRKVLSNVAAASYQTFRDAGVGFGAYVRTAKYSGGRFNINDGHSLIVLSYNTSGITYLDCNGDGRGLIRVTTRSWSEFNTGLVSGKGRRIYAVVQNKGCGCSEFQTDKYTAAADVKMYSGHGTGYSTLGTIPAGTTVKVTMSNAATGWGHVSYNSVQGHVPMGELSNEKELRVTRWASETAFGATATNMKAGGQYYYCFRLYDGVTRKDWDEVYDGSFKVTMKIYDSNGNLCQEATFSEATGAVKTRFSVPGKYTCKITVNTNPQWAGNSYFTVNENPKLVHTSASEVNLEAGQTKSIQVWNSGYHSGSTTQAYVLDNDNIQCTWGKRDADGRIPLNITGKADGFANLTVQVKDRQTGEVLHSRQVKVSVAAPAPQIDVQPVSVTGGEGERVNVTVQASGEDLTYRWYYQNAGAAQFSLTNSFKGDTYSVAMNSDRDGRRIYCVITDRYGRSVQTDTVTLTMDKTLKLLEQPQSVTAAEGEQVKVTVKASGVGLTYQWYFKNANAANFSLTETFQGSTYAVTMNGKRADRQIYCVITDRYGSSVQTDTVTLSMQ